jgi:hypothetical protein
MRPNWSRTYLVVAPRASVVAIGSPAAFVSIRRTFAAASILVARLPCSS